MATIEDQRKWERDMTALGVSRFRAQDQKALETKRYTDTSAGSRLLRVYLSQVSEEIADRLASPITRNKFSKLVRGIDCDKLAMFTLYRIIECLYKPCTVQTVCREVGNMVEDELRFSKFEIELPEYYNAVQRDLDARHSTQYKHRHRVLVSMMNQKEVPWVSWTNETHIGVGAFLVGCAMSASDLVVRTRQNGGTVIKPSDAVVEWISKHQESVEVLLPDRMPCIIEPADWTSWKDGGFYTNRLRGLTPLVKTRHGQQRDTQAPMLDTASIPVILASVNAQQKTPWRVNTRILDVVREVWDRGLELGMPRSQPYEIPKAPIPEDKKPKDLSGEEKLAFEEWKAEARTLHSLETDRKSSVMAVVRAMRMASRLDAENLFWIVYQLDFRGRGYSTTSGVSPQGSDVSKALLQFGRGKRMGTAGWYWFRVHGANKFGYDKVSYDDRVKWVKDNHDSFVRCGSDPIANADVWKDADKPYQFLAWCMEYSAAASLDHPMEYVSHLPVALDGSCNGLQHFSAMLRDPVGGRSVNLTKQDKPADIYQDVADVATDKLKSILTQPDHEHYVLAANWMGLFNKVSSGRMPRKLSKKPVMTLPYGSTLQTCTQSVHAWYIELKVEHFPKNTAFKHSVFMAQVLWESIGEVVIAARQAMSWLQKCARILAAQDELGLPLVYITPLGFPMVQFSPRMDKKAIEAQIGGRLQMQIKKELPGVDRFKAASGSSPNIVHAIDASHMHMVVAAAVEKGITDFAMIHDDFGVHACHVPEFQKIIREEFVKLHETDILTDFALQQETRWNIELPEVPSKGGLHLPDVLDSPYFFG